MKRMYVCIAGGLVAGSVLSGCSSAERNHSDTPPSVEEMNQGGGDQ